MSKMQYWLRRTDYNKVLNLNEKHYPANFQIFERGDIKSTNTIFFIEMNLFENNISLK